MSVRCLVLGAVLLTIACAGQAMGWFQDYFPPGADGSFNFIHGSGGVEGYGSSNDGRPRLAHRNVNYGFIDFRYAGSDGKNHVEWGHGTDLGWTFRETYKWPAGGKVSDSWFKDKKVITAMLYIKNDSGSWCDKVSASGTYLADPVTILGLRCGNLGGFNQRGYRDADGVLGGFTGAAGTYNAALVYPDSMAPVAWRIGIGTVSPEVYTAPGDIGTSGTVSGGAISVTAQYWKISAKESTLSWRNQPLQAGTSPFDPEADGLGAYSGPTAGTGADMFAIKWLVLNSKAHVINSQVLDNSQCAEATPGDGGGKDPRNNSGQAPYALGWSAVPIDRLIVELMAVRDDRPLPAGVLNAQFADDEYENHAYQGAMDAAGGVKGLLFTASPTGTPASTAENSTFGSQDQSSGIFESYLDIRATYKGDATNDGKVTTADVSWLASHWNSVMGQSPPPGKTAYDQQGDFNLDGKDNIGDLNLVAANWGKSFFTTSGIAEAPGNEWIDFIP